MKSETLDTIKTTSFAMGFVYATLAGVWVYLRKRRCRHKNAVVLDWPDGSRVQYCQCCHKTKRKDHPVWVNSGLRSLRDLLDRADAVGALMKMPCPPETIDPAQELLRSIVEAKGLYVQACDEYPTEVQFGMAQLIPLKEVVMRSLKHAQRTREWSDLEAANTPRQILRVLKQMESFTLFGLRVVFTENEDFLGVAYTA